MKISGNTKELKSFPKINLFLKITGKVQNELGSFHSLFSRFMKSHQYCDVLGLTFGKEREFEVVGNFNCPKPKNTIYKAYLAILPLLSKEQKEFLQTCKVEVQKNIPQGGGLGGGSSNAAVFLRFIRELFLPSMSDESLAKVGSSIGSDIPFFIYDFPLAHVSGRGEIVEYYSDELPKLEIINTNIACDTKEVFKCYSQYFYSPLSKNELAKWSNLPNEKLRTLSNIELNDLLQAALRLYPKLEEYSKEGYFFSGSGGSFWKFLN